MCGIVATLPPSPDLTDQALDSLRSRGPDGVGSFHSDFASLGVRRLAITDVSGGSQPLQSPCGRYLLVFNGEVYNHREIRRELKSSGLSFRSDSDGEAILGLYQRHGVAFADRLDGMYALALLDLERSHLVLAVDPVGVKPLYLAPRALLEEGRGTDGEGWVAASTVHALPSALHGQMRRFPPGTVWVCDRSGRDVARRTIELPSCSPEASLLEELRRTVRLQIPEEVPWAVLLSGGLDSALVAALATELSIETPTGKVLAYTVGTPGSSDVAAAGRLAAELGLEHRVVPVPRPELASIVERVIEATATFDPYVVMSGVGTFLAARAAASDGVKVLLTGEGADELFAGYDAYARLAPEDLEARLQEDQRQLGVTECLRLDRCTMAWGVEARVPYLSPRVISLARALPSAAKVFHGEQRVLRKHALREAAREVLPAWVVERPKAPFFEGSGLFRPFVTQAMREMPAERLAKVAAASPDFPLDGVLPGWLFSLWRERFPHLAASFSSLVEHGLVRSRLR